MKKLLAIILSIVFVLGIASPAAAATNTTVTLKFFSNLPDRSAGQGLLEQKMIDGYLKANPNVKIQLEALQDEPYKQKFKAYTASNSLPDLFNAWGQPSFFTPVMSNGLAAELNMRDYANYGFFPGSLNGFSYEGKLYGLPRNTDEMVIYYNKDIFAKNKITIPTTLDQLIAVSKTLRAKGITPCATNGKDKWTLAILYHDLALKISGDVALIPNAVGGKVSFAKDPSLVSAANQFKALMDTKFFQNSFTSADYGAGKNLFAQGKAAMYYMGSWEMGMVSDAQIPANIRKNIGVMKFPAVTGGKGKITDEMAWNGGGHAVAAASAVKDDAIQLLNYIYMPSNWGMNAWQLGVCMPAQKFDTFMSGKETAIQKDIVNILNNATSLSGVTMNDLGLPSFKTDSENLCQQLAAGMITPAKFLEGLDKAAAKK